MAEEEIIIPFNKLKLIGMLLISLIFLRFSFLMLELIFPGFGIFYSSTIHFHSNDDTKTILCAAFLFIIGGAGSIVFSILLFRFKPGLLINKDGVTSYASYYGYGKLLDWSSINGINAQVIGGRSKSKLLTIVTRNINCYIAADFLKYDLFELEKLLNNKHKEFKNNNI